MAKIYVRVAQEMDFDLVEKHLLVVGLLSGDCFSCRQIGIDYASEKYCPQCRTDFRYVTLRKEKEIASAHAIAKLCAKRPDLTYVEFMDIKEVADRKKARDIFK